MTAKKELMANRSVLIGLLIAVTALLADVDYHLPLANAQYAAATRDASILKAYPWPAADAEVMAGRLRTEYQSLREVRIVADTRVGQILVQAPPAVQAQIAQRLTPPSETRVPAAAAEGAAVPSPASYAPQTLKAATLALRNANTRQVEDALLAVFGQRLTAVAPAEQAAKSYQLALPGGRTMRVDLQPQTNRVAVYGPNANVDAFGRLLQSLDAAETGTDRDTRIIGLRSMSPASARKTVDAIQASNAGRLPHGPMVAMLFQPPETKAAAKPAPVEPTDREPDETGPAAKNGTKEPTAKAEGKSDKSSDAPGMIGSVQIENLEGLDVLVLKGHERDVRRVMAIIKRIEELAAETEPEIVVHFLRHVDSMAITELIIPLYSDIFFQRRGDVSITALVKPNALLLIGRRENVQVVLDLLRKLDKPVDPSTQFQVFRLRHAAAATVMQQVSEFFFGRYGLGTRVRATADFRSNAVIVQASPRDMVEVADLIARLDTKDSEAVLDVRIIKLENSMADELANLLMMSISGQGTGLRTTGLGATPGLQQPGVTAGAALGGALGAANQVSTALRFVTVDTKGQRRLNSGILTDVRITPDTRANALIVKAPAESMELLEALIKQLDSLPPAEAQIKVFTIVNGDAAALADMLQQLFARQLTPGQILVQAAGGQGESLLIQLRFAVDVRTNSIIVSGTMGDLQVVEAILLRLDDSDIRRRRSIVYRLKNAPAADVANSINQFLSGERAVQTLSPGLMSAYEQIEREVVVVPEPVSNSLIVSATPRFFEEIKKIVEKLDERPPMVMIQVLIAEVSLNNTDEFGIELGLQDGLLFDRSLLGNITTLTQTTYNDVGQPTSQGQTIASATYTPGFAFNNQPLGQSSGAGTQSSIGSQGLSHFGLGRTNTELGYGGFVFSASSESVSVLIRALQECRRLEVLSRPQVMTLDNQPAFIQVGQRVPRVSNVTTQTTGTTNSVVMENVGLILGVTPRISPDGLVVMAIDTEKSEVGPEAEGIPISISVSGQVVRSPRINLTMAQTTVSANSGQTVVLGGLIAKSKSEVHRKVPWLGDIPLVGRLFRYDLTQNKRSELLVIMTPHIVRTEADVEAIKRVESARMHWCLGDVVSLHGKGDPRRTEGMGDSDTPVIYPDMDPGAQRLYMNQNGKSGGPEILPTPAGTPDGKGTLPPAAKPNTTLRLGEPPSEPKTPAAPLEPQPMSDSGAHRALPAGRPVYGPSPVVPAGYQAPPPASNPGIPPAYVYPPQLPPAPPQALTNPPTPYPPAANQTSPAAPPQAAPAVYYR
jgi:type II secretion system protein D